MKRSKTDQMLRKRACPKFGVESSRHSDKHDLRLVLSVVSWNSSGPLAACAFLSGAKLARTIGKGKMFTQKPLELADLKEERMNSVDETVKFSVGYQGVVLVAVAVLASSRPAFPSICADNVHSHYRFPEP